jgi:hypothetical protein
MNGLVLTAAIAMMSTGLDFDTQTCRVAPPVEPDAQLLCNYCWMYHMHPSECDECCYDCAVGQCLWECTRDEFVCRECYEPLEDACLLTYCWDSA